MGEGIFVLMVLTTPLYCVIPCVLAWKWPRRIKKWAKILILVANSLVLYILRSLLLLRFGGKISSFLPAAVWALVSYWLMKKLEPEEPSTPEKAPESPADTVSVAAENPATCVPNDDQKAEISFREPEPAAETAQEPVTRVYPENKKPKRKRETKSIPLFAFIAVCFMFLASLSLNAFLALRVTDEKKATARENSRAETYLLDLNASKSRESQLKSQVSEKQILAEQIRQDYSNLLEEIEIPPEIAGILKDRYCVVSLTDENIHYDFACRKLRTWMLLDDNPNHYFVISRDRADEMGSPYCDCCNK